MSTTYVAELDQIEFPAISPQGSTVVRIAADRLDVGMYVVELDRPWTDTPFPSGGLYLSDTDTLLALRAHCASALVDSHVSDPRHESSIRVAARLYDGNDDEPAAIPRVDGSVKRDRDPAFLDTQPAAPTGRLARPRDDVRVSRAWRLRLRRLLLANDRGAGLAVQDYGLLERARSWIAGASRGMLPGAGSMAGLRTVYGSLIGATTHLSGDTLASAMPQARRAYARFLTVHALAVRAARDAGPLPWAQVEDCLAALADSVIQHPDALLWCDRMHEQRSLGNRPAATPAVLMARFARHLGLPRDEIAHFAAIGLACDLGKVRLRRELLNRPGQLSAAEFESVKGHVAESLALLAATEGVHESVMRGVAEHHERANGSGYPAGLKGPLIGLHGACAAIVDCYTALISARSYANPLSPEDALAALLGWSPTLFDASLVEQFALAMGLFPVGSTVELANGGMGVVVEQNISAPAASRVLVLTGPDGKALRSRRDSAGTPAPGNAPRQSGASGRPAPSANPAPRVQAGDRVRIARGLHVGAYGVKLPDYYSRASVIGE